MCSDAILTNRIQNLQQKGEDQREQFLKEHKVKVYITHINILNYSAGTAKLFCTYTAKRWFPWVSPNVCTASFGRAGTRAAHTQSITGRTTTRSRPHPHLHNTPEICFRKHISVMLVYKLVAWGNKLDGCLKQLCREMMATRQVLSSAFCHHFQRLSIWVGAVQAQMQIQICGFWNVHSPIYQPSEMLNI